MRFKISIMEKFKQNWKERYHQYSCVCYSDSKSIKTLPN